MTRSSIMKLALAAVGGLIGVALMLGFLTLANGGHGFVCCTGTTGIGWVVPLIGGVAIGVVSLVLLNTSDRAHMADDCGPVSSACPSCGSAILQEWRLCPHCGQLLECSVSVVGSAHATTGA